MLKIVLLGLFVLIVSVVSIAAYHFLTKSSDSDDLASKDRNRSTVERSESNDGKASPSPTAPAAPAATPATAPAATPNPAAAQTKPKPAANSRTRIRFAGGKSSTTVSGTVALSENGYILGAKKGQVMTVRVTSDTGDALVGIDGIDYGTGTTMTVPSTSDSIYIDVYSGSKRTTKYSLYISIQ